MPKLWVLHCWIVSQDNPYMNLGNFKVILARTLHWLAVPCGLTGTGQTGSTRGSHSPGYWTSSWGQAQANTGQGPMTEQGRAVESWTPALLQHCWKSSSWPRGADMGSWTLGRLGQPWRARQGALRALTVLWTQGYLAKMNEASVFSYIVK